MKRIKANYIDLYNLNIGYFSEQRVKSPDGVTGYRYIIEKPLTDEQQKALSIYKNVIISNCFYKYAPEIKHSTIILLDKAIKSESVTA